MPSDTKNALITAAKIPVVMLAVGETVVWCCLFYVFPALLLRWEQTLGWSKVELTGAITLALLVSAVFSPIFGKLIDRGFGPVLMGVGALLGGLVLWLLVLVSELWQFYAVWIVIGVCFPACLYEPCFALLTRVYGKDAKNSIIMVTLIAGFASTISFPAAYHIANYWGWQTVVQIFAVSVICCGAPLLYFGARSIEKHAVNPTVAGTTARAVYLRSPLFVQLAISFALLAVVHGAALHHLLHILADRGLSPGKSVLVATLIGPMQVVGRIIITAFRKTLPHKWIAYGCFVSMGMAMVLLFISSAGFTIAICFAVIFGSGYGMVSIIRPVIAREMLGDENFGAKSGALAFFYVLGTAAAPYFGSVVWSMGGYDLLIGVLWVLAATGLLLIHLAIAKAYE